MGGEGGGHIDQHELGDSSAVVTFLSHAVWALPRWALVE